MTKTLIKSIFHGPYTVRYPLEKKEPFPASRGRIEINIQDCIFCGLCARRCPPVPLMLRSQNPDGA